MSLLISNAHAAGTEIPFIGDISSLLPLGIFAVAIYFMIIRPQSKQKKKHQALMSSIAKGSEVLTQGGLIGRIVKVNPENDVVQIELNENNVIVIKKNYISAVLPKGTMKSI
jgi:preprotein translocase subunit YajC